MTREKRSYKNYVKRYKEKARFMHHLGNEMNSSMMNFKEYKVNKELYKEKGYTTNINQSIVADQQYAIRYKASANLKKLGKEYGIKEFSDIDIRDIAMNPEQDKGEMKHYLSLLNDKLKETMQNSVDRANFISHEVYGS